MPREGRAQRFLIDPLAVTRDPVRRAMSPAAQGIYDTLWLESWMEKEPGVLPANETILAGLAGVSAETWASVRDEVVTGFNVTRDTWRCAAVTATKDAQDTMRDGLRKRQDRKRKRDRDSGVVSRVGSSTGSGSGPSASESTHLSAAADVSVPRVNGTALQPRRQERTRPPAALSAACEAFFQAYPSDRRSGRPSTAKAWAAQGCESIAPEIMAGLDKWTRSDRWSRDRQFIALSATWLNDRRWEVPPEKPRRADDGWGFMDKP